VQDGREGQDGPGEADGPESARISIGWSLFFLFIALRCSNKPSERKTTPRSSAADRARKGASSQGCDSPVAPVAAPETAAAMPTPIDPDYTSRES